MNSPESNRRNSLASSVIFALVQKKRYYLREHREEKGLSQPKLAAKTDTGDTRVDIRTIQNIEAKPNEVRQGRVIRALEVALDLPAGGLKLPPQSAVEPEQGAVDLSELLQGPMAIDGIELTEEEKKKILQMARILRGG